MLTTAERLSRNVRVLRETMWAAIQIKGGKKMPNTCSVCGITFQAWKEYHDHTAQTHTSKAGAQRAAAPIQTVVAGKRRPLTREEKAEIVARGEARLGAHHFFGRGNV